MPNEDWCEDCHLFADDFVEAKFNCADCGKSICEEHAYLNWGIQCNDCLNDTANEDPDEIF